ncbi:MAG: hypothetical protein ACREO0_06830 [Pseudoxanthomonas sp.]
MKPFLRHRMVRLLRLPALALLVLAVLVNPVFAAVGDLHESSHGSAEHAQPLDVHDHAGTQEEEGDLLHALMHAAHCCGHLTAILSAPFVPYAPSSSGDAPMPAFASPHSPPRTDPFRPPIAI